METLFLICTFFVRTISFMKNTPKRGRPRKEANLALAERVHLRITQGEKQGFQEAAHLSGLEMSAWIRERLRMIAAKELLKAGQAVPFLPPKGD